MIDIGVTGKSTLRLLAYQAVKAYPTSALLPLLEDTSSIVRTAAARELQMRGEEGVFAHGEVLLRSPKAPHREIAAFLLGQLGTPQFPFKERTVPLLERSLATDPSDAVREAAAAGLGHLNAEESIPILLKAAQDQNPGVRAAVASSLGRFRHDKRAASCLRKLRRDSDESVRFWASDD